MKENRIVYPISINVYDSNNQVAIPITVQGNAELFNFIERFSNETRDWIVYPILIKNSEDIYTVIRSNKQLELVVDTALMTEIKSQTVRFDQNNITKY